ncbi:GNAT family N-acetyltransferase [Agrococcus sp. SGAir0287]|uniref:GNAT family N-acetyltransferase n=1 Tax=Agrococcus sp. SGAir0287 TaxID=2070347 RepID=UPI0010CCDE7C|nr:GNAT family N-acetyltransferase [Agrococcus sp. SGAir0287]QCR19977.1 GNAT family N-acetyltransferase [Agrococcus sp. SGAir0287]
MHDLRLEELNAKNAVAANGLTLKRGQEAFLVPASNEAYVDQSSTWTRVVYAGDELVAYIMANFDPEARAEEYRCSVLRMHVAATAQGQGVGTYAVDQVAAEGKRRGFDALYAIWEQGELGPEPFFTAIGFEVVGQTEFGDQIGRRPL